MINGKARILVFAKTTVLDISSSQKESHLDFVIISSRHKQRLLFMKINSSDGTCGQAHVNYIV